MLQRRPTAYHGHELSLARAWVLSFCGCCPAAAGKSTLADQLLIKTDTVENREMQVGAGPWASWFGGQHDWSEC